MLHSTLCQRPATEGGNCAESDRDFDCAYRIHFNSRSSAKERVGRRVSTAEERVGGWWLSAAKEPVEEVKHLSTANERLGWRLSTDDECLEKSECLSASKECVDRPLVTGRSARRAEIPNRIIPPIQRRIPTMR